LRIEQLFGKKCVKNFALSSFSQVFRIMMKIVMMLNYSFQENIDSSETLLLFDAVSSKEKSPNLRCKFRDFRIISEKIRIPQPGNSFERPRLNELLGKQIEQFGASLILGRAGTGKTTVAVNFARDYERVAWFRVESAESDWETFSQYFVSGFRISLPEADFSFAPVLPNQTTETRVLNFLEQLFSVLEKVSKEQRILIVLDDLHSVFDAEWFETFFKCLFSYEIPNIQILLLSRSKPPFPLWRLRSKQKLGVLEENLLLFTINELEEFLKSKEISKEKIRRIHKSSFGRVSKILDLQDFQSFR